jgi:hypothetical protein
VRDWSAAAFGARFREGGTTVKKLAACAIWIAMLALAPGLVAQGVQVGDNTHMNAGALLTAGYTGDYGNQIQSNHGLTFGAGGTLSGYYYNPNFLNFNITPYYNQSKNDSDSQSLTNSSGVAATANFFTGSHFPGSVSYHYDDNSTGTSGLVGSPNFATQGSGQGIGVNWSALIPDWPTLSVGYQQGSGSGTVYGTDQETSASQHLLNVRSSYRLDGFNLNAYYDHNTLRTVLPQFLSGNGEDVQNSTGNDFGFGASRNIPIWNGQFYANYTHSTISSDFLASGQSDTTTGYTADIVSSGATFRPSEKLGLFVNQSFTNNLSAYLNQGLINNGTNQPLVNLGLNSYSSTFGGGANYTFTKNLWVQGQANYYQQSYFGNTYTGTYLSGNVNYGRKLFDMFTFSAGIVDSSNGLGTNNVGFIGTMNYYRRFGQWETAGTFSYAQNVQSVLITETTSYYNYNANIHRRFSSRVQWTAVFNGNHTGLSSQKNSDSHSESYATSLSLRHLSFNAQYLTGMGNSILTVNGIVPIPPTPGVPEANVIQYNAKSYGGGIAWSPIRRLTLNGTYNRSLSDTLSGGTFSKNNTEIINGQLQYRLRRIGILAGYTRFTQGISASGFPAGTTTSYFGGISRWFDFF